jgi:hypothetical protein
LAPPPEEPPLELLVLELLELLELPLELPELLVLLLVLPELLPDDEEPDDPPPPPPQAATARVAMATRNWRAFMAVASWSKAIAAAYAPPAAVPPVAGWRRRHAVCHRSDIREQRSSLHGGVPPRLTFSEVAAFGQERTIG